LQKIWSERDVQIMILISTGLQLILLLCGNRRRRRRVSEWLRLIVWLSYLGAFAAATSGISLFSQYEDKYKLRSVNQSSESIHTLTLPFLWVPFFILHLGGQDTITAYSVEDNNLWLRLLLNLLFQLGLALYVFRRSFDLLKKLLPVAVPLFVAGIFKCAERIWALKSGSRDNLDYRTMEDEVQNYGLPPRSYVGATTDAPPSRICPPEASTSPSHAEPPGVRRPDDRGGPPEVSQPEVAELPEAIGLDMPSEDEIFVRQPPPLCNVVETYALKTTLGSRGLLVGRTLLQLGTRVAIQLVDGFTVIEQTEVNTNIVLMELGMIYDMLYTKAMLLNSWKGRSLRCVAMISLVGAFVLFLVYQQQHASNTANAVITYALFVVAIFIELYSIFMVIVSPWTRAGYKDGTSFFFELSRKAFSGLPTPTMGQLNITDYSLSKKSTPKFITTISEALGLDKHWRNFWHVKHVDNKEIMDYISGFFDTKPDHSRNRFKELELGEELAPLLTLPFEHALFRLHIFTDMHISSALSGAGNMKTLAEDCRKLSNYLVYLMVVYPSMLSVSSAAQDLEPSFTEWVSSPSHSHRGTSTTTKAEILKKYADDVIHEQLFMPSRLRAPPCELSLKELKEVWARLLIYSAGKCPMELHGRQLGEGVELLSVVWSLMMHHGVGEVGRQLNLLAPRAPEYPALRGMPLVSTDRFTWVAHPEEPLYAFTIYFGDPQDPPLTTPPAEFSVAAWAPPVYPPSQEVGMTAFTIARYNVRCA
jgi:hypothetical protein